MTSIDFRSLLIQEVREFENWVWKDSRENPDDYQDMTYEKWYDLFNGYRESNKLVTIAAGPRSSLPSFSTTSRSTIL